MKKTHPLILPLLLLAPLTYCSEFQEFAATNEVSLVFEVPPPEPVAQVLRQDLLRCLVPSRPFLKTTPLENGEDGETLLVGLWTPEPSLSGLTLPNSGQLTNGVFQLPISDSFLAQVCTAQTNLVSWSNEVAQADQFVQSLSSTNLAAMSSDAIFSLRLTKTCPPGQHDVPQSSVLGERAFFESLTFYPPPRLSFSVRSEGPSGGGPYLWCQIPAVAGQDVFTFSLIFYANQWWFSDWYSERGSQKW